MDNTLNIRSVFQNERFQKIQDALASSIGLAMITVDYKGFPVTKHSSRSDFCTIMRESEHFHKLCELCDARGGLEAARTHSPYIYLCHAGLVDLAIPIVLDNNYIGAVMAGQVFLSKSEDNLQLEQIYHSFENNVSFEDVNTLKAYRAIPVMPLYKVRMIADMLFSICTILVDEARLRYIINDLKNNKEYIHVEQAYIDKFTHIISDRYYDITLSESKNSEDILSPAFDYIKNNLDGDLSINKVASICNVSKSYFSKLFAKESLGSYSDYINNLKVDHAKNLLSLTDLSINEISEKLGYNDCGYFIKVFKKMEELTPAAYRKLKSKKK